MINTNNIFFRQAPYGCPSSLIQNVIIKTDKYGALHWRHGQSWKFAHWKIQITAITHHPHQQQRQRPHYRPAEGHLQRQAQCSRMQQLQLQSTRRAIRRPRMSFWRKGQSWVQIRIK